VGDEILALEKLHRMRRHHRQFQAGSKMNRALDVVFGMGMAGTLQLDIETLREKLRPLLCQLLCLLRIVGKQRMADIAEMRARQRNQPFGARFAEPSLVDLRPPAVLIVAVGARQPIAQPQVARGRGAQQQRPERLVAVGFVADPDVAADDRLESLAARRLVELHHAEDVGEVGQRQRRHCVRLCCRYCAVEPCDAVNDRIFAVQAQVDKLRLHGRHFTPQFRPSISIRLRDDCSPVHPTKAKAALITEDAERRTDT